MWGWVWGTSCGDAKMSPRWTLGTQLASCNVPMMSPELTAATLRISDGDPHMAGCDPKPLRDGQHPHTFSALTSNGSPRGRAALGSDDGGVTNAHANAHGGMTNAHGGVVVPPCPPSACCPPLARAALGSDDGGVTNAHPNAHGGVTNAHGGVAHPPVLHPSLKCPMAPVHPSARALASPSARPTPIRPDASQTCFKSLTNTVQPQYKRHANMYKRLTIALHHLPNAIQAYYNRLSKTLRTLDVRCSNPPERFSETRKSVRT